MTAPIEPDFPAIYDEFTGVGGRYLRDPETGTRQPAPPDEASPAEETEQ